MTPPRSASANPGEKPNAGTWRMRVRDRRLRLALKPGVTRAEFEQSIHEKRAEELLNWINIYAGEMIYVAGGTVHTLGPGAVIVETQQQSDTTYRLYDYGRPRPLHLERGIASVKEQVASGKVIRPAPVNIDGGKNRLSAMIAAPYFTVDLFELKEPHDFSTRDAVGKRLGADSGCGGRVRDRRSCRPSAGDAIQGRCGRDSGESG